MSRATGCDIYGQWVQAGIDQATLAGKSVSFSDIYGHDGPGGD